MNTSQALLPSGAVSTEIAEIVERLTARIKAGERFGPDELAVEFPDHADALSRLLPTMQMLAGLSESVGREGGETVLLTPAQPLGDFRLIREVGRGGMGIVYEGEQLSLRRRVALKILPFAGTLDPKQLQRFKREVQAAAHLDHPNIVPVHFVGCDRDVHYYAMRYIEGQ